MQYFSPQFSAVEDFDLAKSLAGELLDGYITGGIRLAWMMVTRVPPMIAVEPAAYNPHTTILEGANNSDVTLKRTISTRPILYFSYEGQVAVQGIVTIPPTRPQWVLAQVSKFNQGMQSPMNDGCSNCYRLPSRPAFVTCNVESSE